MRSKIFLQSIQCALFCLLMVNCSAGKGIQSLQAPNPPQAIIGGDPVLKNSELAKRAVMIRTVIATNTDDLSISYEICTGSVIANNMILTAAHCIVDAVDKMEIVYTTEMQDEAAPISKVESVQVHESYQGTNQLNLTSGHIDDDIAIIKIKGQVPEDYKVLGVASAGTSNYKFDFLTIGFGRNTGVLSITQGTDLGQGVLRVATSTLTSFNAEFNYFESDQTLGKGACYGDSGGPALLLVGDEFKILGVTKAVFSRESNQKADTDTCKFNALYMNVQYYQKWISDSIAKLNLQTK